MEHATKISFSAVIHSSGSGAGNMPRIYANGRFLNSSAAAHIQTSVELTANKCLFSLMEGMEEEASGISMINDLKKYQQKLVKSSKDIHVKLDEIIQYVDQNSNLLHSASLGDNIRRNPNFSALLIDEGSIAAVNLGASRIYRLEGNTFRQMIHDFKKADKLHKMGLINDEQAEMLSRQMKSPIEEVWSTVKKSDPLPFGEDAVYMILNNGLINSINEDTIYEIASSGNEPDIIAGMLMEQALSNAPQEHLAAVVISAVKEQEIPMSDVERRTAQLKQEKSSRKVPSKMLELKRAETRRRHDPGRSVSVAVLVLLIAAVLFGGFKLWKAFRDTSGEQTTAMTSTEQAAEVTMESSGVAEEASLPETEEVTAPTEGAVSANTTPAAVDNQQQTVTEYTVQSGDSLSLISQKVYGVQSKVQQIMDANGITNPDKIAIGQVLKIPQLPKE